MTTVDYPKAIATLKHLIAGREFDFTAAATHQTPEQVRQIAQSHGYPDDVKMKWAVDVLTKNLEQQTKIPERAAERPVRAAQPAQVAARPIPAAQPPALQPFSVIESMLEDAAGSPHRRTVTKAKRIRELLTELEQVLEGEAEERQQIEAERERKEQLLKAKADLEAKLAKVKAQLSGRAGATPGVAVACPDCPKTFSGDQGLRIHRARIHDEKAA